MEEPSMAMEEVESEEIADHFLCCICLDLLYKPVVLSCGHMSCFWCIHKSMDGHRKSQCPICRCPYLHFPSICRMLHFLLVKMYPDTYKRREKQTLAEERKSHYFSPQFGAHLQTPLHSNSMDADSSSKSEPSADIEQTVGRDAKNHTQNAHDLSVVDEADGAPGNKSNENEKPVSIHDVLCVSCKQLLIRPIVLNCGDVYCQSCLSNLGTEKLKCQECESHHPGNLPNVCLELDFFLQEQFFNEYASRRSATQPEQSNSSTESSKAADASGSSKGSNGGLSFTGAGEDIHVGVGCDYCGMYPIIGDRYRCQDCVERIGFDLCKSCHECYSKLPGRFNQQHKPDHKFTLINRKQHPRNIRVFQQLGDDGRPCNFLLFPYPEHFVSSPSDSNTEASEVVQGVTELNLQIPVPEAVDVENPTEDESENQ